MKKLVFSVSILSSFFTPMLDAKPIALESSEVKMEAVEVKKQHLSWQTIESLSHNLHAKLPKRKWKGIIAITRGGMAPALMMSQLLDIRRIETVGVKSYSDENKQGELTIINAPTLPDGGKDWLVLDDLADSGATLVAVRKQFPNAFFATLIAKPKGAPTVDVYAQESAQNVWIVFPWENF